MTGKYQCVTDPRCEVIVKYLPIQKKRSINQLHTQSQQILFQYLQLFLTSQPGAGKR